MLSYIRGVRSLAGSELCQGRQGLCPTGGEQGGGGELLRGAGSSEEPTKASLRDWHLDTLPQGKTNQKPVEEAGTAHRWADCVPAVSPHLSRPFSACSSPAHPAPEVSLIRGGETRATSFVALLAKPGEYRTVSACAGVGERGGGVLCRKEGGLVHV